MKQEKLIKILNREGTFSLENPENYSYLYFPIAGEQGLKSVVTPNLGGDSKLDQNTFVLEPVSVENLHNNRSTRNFWCCMEDGELWSVTGQSSAQEADKFTSRQDQSELIAGLMWHKVNRKKNTQGLEATVTSFVPVDTNVEIMQVELTNNGDTVLCFTPVAAVPIYGRSADNIRDHRHVTSLLHRIRTTEHGVIVRPTLSFDERGHRRNEVSYYVCGITGDGNKPEQFYPITEEFLGEGGTFTRPGALLELTKKAQSKIEQGKEALGGIRFSKCSLNPGESCSYTILIGATQNEEKVQALCEQFSTSEKVLASLEQTKEYWQKKVNVDYYTGDESFDNYMRWVSFQPFLRRIYGCSFLPYHDYGKGGRGWRDLWQDCLALLVMDPSQVRQMIIDNYGGVRLDGTNATIIGEKQGQFIADRNNITRVWMDHGMWPFLTTKLYIDQTGDLDILNQQMTYFKDPQVERGTAKDEEWNETYGNQQKDAQGNLYQGTILEHLLLQHLCAFYEVGAHNHIRLRGADWNDALDMAEEKGESVAFTCAYAGNLKQLARYIRILKRKYKQQTILLMEEMMELLGDESYIYEDVTKKLSLLTRYVKQCRHKVSGAKVALDAEVVAQNLDKKADWMMQNIRKNEWVTDSQGNGWLNSYYDNSGNQVEGETESGVRMMLTGQVFGLLSKTPEKDQMEQMVRSAKKYLYEKEVGGYRLNTDFHEEKYDMGRMFGFAYGEKENGAVFSHMAVMYANGLYTNGFVKEGYEALKSLADSAIDFNRSKMFPGIPEYFNNQGRGMYSYLTGAASWYMLTMITEAFGVKGEIGNLVLEPKLVKEQFDEEGYAKLQLPFAGAVIEIVYHNPSLKDCGQYRITHADCCE
jgi:Cellobiose phosphorylase